MPLPTPAPAGMSLPSLTHRSPLILRFSPCRPSSPLRPFVFSIPPCPIHRIKGSLSLGTDCDMCGLPELNPVPMAGARASRLCQALLIFTLAPKAQPVLSKRTPGRFSGKHPTCGCHASQRTGGCGPTLSHLKRSAADHCRVLNLPRCSREQI